MVQALRSLANYLLIWSATFFMIEISVSAILIFVSGGNFFV